MKKVTAKNLKLSKETLRTLSQAPLAEVGGGSMGLFLTGSTSNITPAFSSETE